MPGHTYWRTITANRKSITKASSSLLDFSSMFPTLGETQARYVNPAARPALALLPHRPLPVAPPLRPFPLPSAPSTPPRRRRRPSPLPSFPAGSALWLLLHPPPYPDSIPLAVGPLLRGRTPDPFRGVSFPAGSLLSRSLHSLTHAHPYPAPGASRSVLSSSHPHPAWPMGLSCVPDPSPLRVRELPTRNAGSLGACPVAYRVAAGSELGFGGSPGGEGRSPRASGLCKPRRRCPFPRNRGEEAARRSVALSASPESPRPVTAGSLEL